MIVRKSEQLDIEEHSEEVTEIIGKLPNKIFSRTIYAILLILVIVFIAAYFISYPEKITGEITVYNESQPVKVICQQNIQIAKLFVKDGNDVDSGQRLALINNPTNYNSIEYLRKISSDNNYVFDHIEKVISNDDMNLSFGEMQLEYNNLIVNLLKYKDIISLRKQVKLTSMIASQKSFDSLRRIINRKTANSLDDFSKETERFGDYSKLYNKGVISKHEYFNAMANLSNARSQIETNEKEMVQNRLTASERTQDIYDYKTNLSIEKERLSHDIFANIRNIEVFIKNWDQKYIIRAFKKGKINFLNTISEGQYYKIGDELFIILMPNKGIFGIANITSEGAGKIEINQRARIKLKKYPFAEYGFINGIVNKISSVPNNSNYKLKINIVNVESEILGKKLKDEQEAIGEVDIIVKDRSLLERLFVNIVKTVRN